MPNVLSFINGSLQMLRAPSENTQPDACRITGQVELNKVTGNFHITLGKSLSVPGGHIHLQQLFPVYHANFSHRIDKFFFGEPGPAILHPLDSSIKTAVNSKWEKFGELREMYY